MQAVLSGPYDFGGSQLSTSASIGVAVYPDHAGDAATLLEAADTSMYAGKRAGRGRVTMAGEHADAA